MTGSTSTSMAIRYLRPGDIPEVLALLRESLGPGPAGERTEEFFAWKHLDNPFGRSLMLVAEEADTIVGFRAFLRWDLVAGDQVVPAVRAVDTATHPAFRGRGIFSTLTQAALDTLRSEGTRVVFNTPNDLSRPGYLKMGWRSVGRVPVFIRPRRPLRMLRSRAASEPSRPRPRILAPPAGDVLRREEIEALRDAGSRDGRLRTMLTVDYLRWRYADGPVAYNAVTEEVGGRLEGVAILRIRSRGGLWESSIAEVLAGDERTARSLVRQSLRAAGTDHATCSFPSGSLGLAAARRAAFLRSPRGPLMVVNVLDPTVAAGSRDDWALGLGDLEVF